MDRELRGFGVRVSPTGLKVYLIQYRSPEGKGRPLSMGRHGLLTVLPAELQAGQRPRRSRPRGCPRAARRADTSDDGGVRP